MIRKNDNISTVKLCTRQSKEVPSENENYNPVQNSYAALWDELRDIQSTIPALNVMRRILEYYFLQLCGYEGSDIRELVLEKEENRKMFIKQVEGQKPDMTDYQLASSLLAYINNPNGISDGLNYVEDCDDVEAYRDQYCDGVTVIKDVAFKSASTAANFVTGRSTNGLIAWKNSDGQTLKALLSD